MSILTFLRSIIVLVVFNVVISVQTVEIPTTNAGKSLTVFLNAVESGELEQLVNNYFHENMFKEISPERHINFLKRMHRMHGGFTVFKITESQENYIKIIAKGINSNAWRIFVIQTKNQVSDKITGIDVRETTPPMEYLATLPKIDIKRPVPDNSIVQGVLAEEIDKYMTD
ncbi:MAG: hypothetical protein R6V04_10415, partial [bacterium]